MKIESVESLDAFLKRATETTEELLASNHPLIPALHEFHAFFVKDLWGVDRAFRPVPFLLAMNAHFYWLAAVRVALSGQMTGVFPLLRTGLEAHCYVALMMSEERLEAVWTDRERSADSRKQCRRDFTAAVSDLARKLEAEEVGSGGWILEHYEEAIDWGGHPNVKIVFQHLNVEDRGEDVLVQAVALRGADHPATTAAIFACLDLGFAMAVVAAKSVPKDAKLYARLNELNEMKNSLGERLSAES
ncbi:MAG: hypothetical protein SWI22_02680 [Pseudomonadota bacterium]|nr:hypothetical protein [Pseudomonadota bacterium]